MRELSSHKVNGCNDGLSVTVMDERGAGNANHVYRVAYESNGFGGIVADLHFQNGPLRESGINGITHEVLLAILEDRLVGFQAGKFSCVENENALQHIREAQAILKSRTEARLKRGVEGTHTV